MKRRLLTVQGPLQYITGYIAYRWQRPPSPGVEDVLLLYDFLAAPEIEEQIAEAVRVLSASVPWAKVVYIKGNEMRALMRNRYSCSVKYLQARIGASHFDEIYLMRDYLGHGSPLLLNAYPAARKVIYGDSFGVIGQKGSVAAIYDPKSAAARLRLNLRRLLLGEPRAISFDDAVLTLPIDMTGRSLQGIDLAVPSRDHVLACIEQIYGAVPALCAYCESLCAAGRSGSSHLYLLSNLSASGLSDSQQEIALYLEVIREQSPVGGTVYLKPHPRSTFEVLNALADQLKDAYRVIVVDEARFARMPIELWIGLIRHCEVVAMFSTSAINLKYLFDKDVTLPLTETRIAQYIKPVAIGHVSLSQRLMREALANLDRWDGKTVLWSPSESTDY